MRVDCPHCQQKAIISSTNSLSPTAKDLYCICTNVAGGCGASFVYKLGYSHDLNPPIKCTVDMAAHIIKNLSAADKQALMQSDLFN